jgi:hypothetical protein
MNAAACETWNEAVNATDAFGLFFKRLDTTPLVTFGGVASPLKEDDYSDILTSREITAEAFDLLDDSPTR